MRRCSRRCGWACYELIYCEGAPAYAIVDDAVRAGGGSRPRRAGLVNAVLRRAAREGARRCSRGSVSENSERAAVLHSHPQWIARAVVEELGAEQARALMAADNQPGELALRANTLVSDADDAREGSSARERTRDPQMPEALVVEEPLDAHATALWRGGALHRTVARRDARRARPRPAARASACSTCAPRPAARRRTSRR